MEKSYWEKIAPSYETEIFDVLKNDKHGKIVKAIQSFASKDSSIIDIGCAVGKWLPVIAPIFKGVKAIDISSKNLKIAAAKYPEYKNVQYERIDMSAKKIKAQKYDAAICINAILTESLPKRNLFFKHMTRFIKKGETLLYVPLHQLLTLDMAMESPIGSLMAARNFRSRLISPKHSFLATLCMEEIRKHNSPFAKFIDILPKSFNNFPIFYTQEERQLLNGSPF